MKLPNEGQGVAGDQEQPIGKLTVVVKSCRDLETSGEPTGTIGKTSGGEAREPGNTHSGWEQQVATQALRAIHVQNTTRRRNLAWHLRSPTKWHGPQCRINKFREALMPNYAQPKTMPQLPQAPLKFLRPGPSPRPAQGFESVYGPL